MKIAKVYSRLNGVEFLLVHRKKLWKEISSGPAYYEGELYSVISNGRRVPAVPLVIIGVAA